MPTSPVPTRRHLAGIAAAAVALVLLGACSSTTPTDDIAPATSAVLGGSGDTAPTSTSMPSNSEGGSQGDSGGTISRERPQPG